MEHNIWKLYNETIHVRYTKKQKKHAREILRQEYEKMGYQTFEEVEERSFFGKAIDLFVGNSKQAKTFIVVPYDTPQKIFWWKSEYYPLDGNTTSNKTMLPIFGPVFVLYLFVLFLMYGAEGFINDTGTLQMLMAVVAGLILILFYFMIHGIANRHNANRHDASLYCAHMLAKQLSKDQRREVAFIFIDKNSTRHIGAKAAAKHLAEKHKNANVIVLQPFAKGSVMQIGYSMKQKRLAQDLNRAFAPHARLKMVALDARMQMSSPMEYFQKAVVIGAGELDNKQRLCVSDTATSKDKTIDEQNIEKVLQMLLEYVK